MSKDRKYEDLSESEKKFYDSFTTQRDTLTVFMQIDKVKNRMMERLKDKHGDVIPVQTGPELLKEFNSALIDLGY